MQVSIIKGTDVVAINGRYSVPSVASAIETNTNQRDLFSITGIFIDLSNSGINIPADKIKSFVKEVLSIKDHVYDNNSTLLTVLSDEIYLDIVGFNKNMNSNDLYQKIYNLLNDQLIKYNKN